MAQSQPTSSAPKKQGWYKYFETVRIEVSPGNYQEFLRCMFCDHIWTHPGSNVFHCNLCENGNDTGFSCKQPTDLLSHLCSTAHRQKLFQVTNVQPLNGTVLVRDVRNKMISMILCRGDVFSLIEEPNVKSFFPNVCRGEMPQLVAFVKGKIDSEIISIVKKYKTVFLSFDGWTCKTQNVHYIGITLVGLDEDSNTYEEHFLGLYPLLRETGMNIKNVIQKVIQDYGLTGSLVCFTTDNAANVKLACKLLGYIDIPCIIHSIELVAGKFIEAIAPYLDPLWEVQKMVDDVGFTLWLKEDPSREVSFRLIPGKCPTRWWALQRTFETLEKDDSVLNDYYLSHPKLSREHFDESRMMIYQLRAAYDYFYSFVEFFQTKENGLICRVRPALKAVKFLFANQSEMLFKHFSDQSVYGKIKYELLNDILECNKARKETYQDLKPLLCLAQFLDPLYCIYLKVPELCLALMFLKYLLEMGQKIHDDPFFNPKKTIVYGKNLLTPFPHVDLDDKKIEEFDPKFPNYTKEKDKNDSIKAYYLACKEQRKAVRNEKINEIMENESLHDKIYTVLEPNLPKLDQKITEFPKSQTWRKAPCDVPVENIDYINTLFDVIFKDVAVTINKKPVTDPELYGDFKRALTGLFKSDHLRQSRPAVYWNFTFQQKAVPPYAIELIKGIFAILVTSVSTERLFSTARHVTDDRYKMNTAVTTACISCAMAAKSPKMGPAMIEKWVQEYFNQMHGEGASRNHPRNVPSTPRK